MNLPPAKKATHPQPVLKALGKKRVVTIMLDEGIHKAVQGFAIQYGLKAPDVFALLAATGIDALTGDTLRPFAKVMWPAVWEWLANNKPFAETVKKLYRDRLKELQEKIEVKEKE